MAQSRLRLPRFLNSTSPSSLSMKMMWAGLTITAVFILVATLSPAMQAWGWLQNPTDAVLNPIHEPPSVNYWFGTSRSGYDEPPSVNYWFGTSRSGYDVFSRTLFASRAAWQVVILATSLSLFIGVPLGLVSGYLGGKLDRVLLFLMDTIYTLPGLLLSLTLAFVVGKGVLNAAIALSISYIPQYYRVVRNHTASVKTELFVEAARAMGADTWTVLSRYLFLNVIQ